MKRSAALWLLPALAAGLVAPPLRGDGGDTWLFVAAGKTLLSAHWQDAFADPSVQAGPLQLGLYGSVGRSPAALAAVLAVATALLVQAAARAVGIRAWRILVLLGIATLVTGLSTNAFEAGHPADTLLPLLWVIAGAEARRGRTLRAAALVAAGAGLETWGVLGLAVLALAPSVRGALRGLAAAAAALGALYLPFVLGGHFEMGRLHWVVSHRSLVALAIDPGTAVGWPLRLAQGGAALAVGLVVAWTARRSAQALWVVPAVVVGVRLLLDPLASDYYFAGLVGPALVGLALLPTVLPAQGCALFRASARLRAD
jgi:hypothetical protein